MKRTTKKYLEFTYTLEANFMNILILHNEIHNDDIGYKKLISELIEVALKKKVIN